MGLDLGLLRGLIYQKYKTQKAFASYIGWHQNKVSALLTGKYTPDVNEAAALFSTLDMSDEQYKDIFLRVKSPYGDR